MSVEFLIFTKQVRQASRRVAGVVDKPAVVKVNGMEPRMWSLPGGKFWGFDAPLTLSAGTQNVTVAATDGAGHTTSQLWTVQSGGNVANFTYDGNGDTLTKTMEPGTAMAATSNYTWSSTGQLVSVHQGNNTISFTYDGSGHRVQLSANIAGNVTNEYYLWDGDQIVQKRLSGNDSSNIVDKYFGNGYQTVSGGSVTGNYFYTKDHLGSIREVVDGNGTLQGRFDYGPWGETTYMDYSGGTVPQPQFGYAGYFQTAYVAGKYLMENRIYEPSIHRWLSRDPMGEVGGTNLYVYVGNDPVNNTDPSGLLSAKCKAALDNLEEQFAQLVTQAVKYDKIRDAIGGFISPKTGKPTKPGGHGDQIDNRIRSVQSALRRVAQDCKDDFNPPSNTCPAPSPVIPVTPVPNFNPYSPQQWLQRLLPDGGPEMPEPMPETPIGPFEDPVFDI